MGRNDWHVAGSVYAAPRIATWCSATQAGKVGTAEIWNARIEPSGREVCGDCTSCDPALVYSRIRRARSDAIERTRQMILSTPP